MNTTTVLRPLTLLSFLSVALLACGEPKVYMRAQAAEGPGVEIAPERVWVAGHKLWVRAEVINKGTEPIVVDRDAIVARLPGGQTVGRAEGRLTLHQPYYIPAGGAHPVYVEFEELGFDWHTVPEATIDFSAGIRRGDQPVPVHMAVNP